MKTVTILEDYKHTSGELYAGNRYPLEDNIADALIEAGVATVDGKKAKPRATKPVKIKPANTVQKSK